MIRRREFLVFAAAAVTLDGKTAKTLSHKERVDRALEGKDVDRPPFSFWHHFGLTTPEAHTKATLYFHAKYRTDIVKVMSDFPYPAGYGHFLIQIYALWANGPAGIRELCK